MIPNKYCIPVFPLFKCTFMYILTLFPWFVRQVVRRQDAGEARSAETTCRELQETWAGFAKNSQMSAVSRWG